jgi:hypothetical protein
MTTKQQLIRCIRHGARGTQWCLGIVVTIGAAACAPSPEPTHQTVEYYQANPQVREAKVSECANDPGGLGKTPDCINAKQATQIEDIGNVQDLPPMGLLKDAEDGSGRVDSSSGSARPQGTDGPPHETR